MREQRNLVLCGMKHCGKSTHGRRLARMRGAEFVDTDERLEALYRERYGEKLSCREIFRRHGEEFFRRLEAEVISRLAEAAPATGGRVTALGGGVPSNALITRDMLHRIGFCIFLEIDADTAFHRVAAGGLPPFLAGTVDPEKSFAELYRARTNFYRHCADLTVPIRGEEPEDVVAARLAAALGEQ